MATWGTATVAITAQTSNDTMSIVQGNNQSATVNSAFGTALEVAIVDQFANPVPGVNVTFSAPATLASGTFAACSGGNPQTYQCVVATNAAGQATASTYTANTKSGGPYNVTTVAAGVAAPSTFSETNNPGTATLVFTTTTPGSASASATTNIALGLQLVDQFGNNTTSTGTTTLTLSSASAKGFFATTNGASGTLGATANVTFTNGVGNVTEYYGDEKASASTLITAKNGVATWGTATVAITGGTATQVVITPTPGSVGASATTNIALGLQLEDQFGNNTTSVGTTTLTLSSASAKGFFATTNGASGTLGATANVTFGPGVGTATEYYGDEKASASTLITAKNGVATWGTATVAITAQTSNDTMSIVQGNNQSATVNSAFGTALEVAIVDQFANPVPGVNVTFSAPATLASGTFAACSGGNPQTYQCVVATNAAGQATASTYTANTKAGGPYNVTTVAAGVAAPSTFTETNNPGTATQVVITPTPATTTTSAVTNVTLALQLEDQFGNNTTSTGTTTLTLSTSSNRGFFATTLGAGGTSTLNVTFTNGIGTATAYYGDSRARTDTITASNGATTWGTTTVTT